MNSQFQTLFQSGNRNKPRIWLDSITYANRLFAGGKQELWRDPTFLISVLSQAQGLLQSDVIHFPLHQVYAAWVETQSQEVERWIGKRPTFALKKLLASEVTRNIVIDVLKGMTNVNRDSKPLVLSLGSPQKWLQWMSEIVRPGEDPSISHDDVDSASMYLADYLRTYSTTGISAIVLEEAVHPPIGLDEVIELYQPILNLAGHYQWSVGLSLAGESNQWTGINEHVGFTLFGESTTPTLFPYWQQGKAIGGGLNQAFWMRNEKVDGSKLPPEALLFGTIPEEANPEMVLEHLKELRQIATH